MPRKRNPCVYLMASRRNGTLYLGVTSDLVQRVYQHRESVVTGFSRRCRCKVLVWFEVHGSMASAITREKQLKGGNRDRKLALIEAQNPYWNDLYPLLIED
jgi:putative endonuclease